MRPFWACDVQISKHSLHVLENGLFRKICAEAEEALWDVSAGRDDADDSSHIL